MQKKVNHSFKKFLHIIETLLDPPFSPLSKAHQKRKLKPWITKGLLTSINKKNQEKFCRTKNDENKHTLHDEFKKYCNTTLKLTKITKSKHYQTFFLNIRKTLNKLRRALNQLSIFPKLFKYIKLDDQEVTNPFEIQYSFNKCFCTVAQKIEDRIIHTDTKYHDFLDNPASQTFFLSPTDKEEIEQLIKSLSSTKTTGPASIPRNILKMFENKLKTPLSNLVNLYSECGAFPKIPKTPSVTPIYKKDDP